jgi:hypothetical protein
MLKTVKIKLAHQLQIYANCKEAGKVRKTQGRQFGQDRLHGSIM